MVNIIKHILKGICYFKFGIRITLKTSDACFIIIVTGVEYAKYGGVAAVCLFITTNRIHNTSHIHEH